MTKGDDDNEDEDEDNVFHSLDLRIISTRMAIRMIMGDDDEDEYEESLFYGECKMAKGAVVFVIPMHKSDVDDEDEDEINLFYGECKMAKGAVAEVKTSCRGIKSAIKKL